MTMHKMTPGTTFPPLSWSAVRGGDVSPAAGSGWRMLVIYRGRHCPVCKQYIGTLNAMLEEFGGAGIAVYAVSGDTKDKAEAQAGEQGWRLPVGYGLNLDEMHALGLYVSDPRSPQETDRPFAEPGLFVINPSGNVQIISLSNAPVARPDLQMLLGGLKFLMANDYPIRGLA